MGKRNKGREGKGRRMSFPLPSCPVRFVSLPIPFTREPALKFQRVSIGKADFLYKDFLGNVSKKTGNSPLLDDLAFVMKANSSTI